MHLPVSEMQNPAFILTVLPSLHWENMCTDGPVEGSWLPLLLSPCPCPLSGKSDGTSVPHVSLGQSDLIKQIGGTLPLEPSPVFWVQLAFCPSKRSC